MKYSSTGSYVVSHNVQFLTMISGENFTLQQCDKILNFDFNGSYDSYSCNNWVHGGAYHEPSIAGGALCLNGYDQFLFVSITLPICIG